MIIIHDVTHHENVPRLAADRIRRVLSNMPVTVLTGARQTGKSTLAQEIGGPARRYRSLDDFDTLDAARRDPASLLGGPDAVTLDEVQRAPDLLLAVKRAVDRERRPGRFLLTGSADLLLMRQVSESLAGRAGYVTLHPLTRREIEGRGRCGIWEELLNTPEKAWRDLVAAGPERPLDWRGFARRGGFPLPALHLESAEARADWFEGYQRTYLERDLRALAQITALPDFRRLMRLGALRLGQLVNQTGLGRDAALSQPTVRRWLNLLETSYLIVPVPPYSVNRTKRLIKSPKLYWCDTAFALDLGGGEPTGAHLENIVLSDLIAWRDGRPAGRGRAEVFWWRTTLGEEVDFVVEFGDRLLPIEVKATAKPRLRDTAGLGVFQAEYGASSRPGLLLHAGRETFWIASGVLAAPWWRVL